MPRRGDRAGDRAERGSVTPLVVGFASILLMMIAVVVDASAAFLTRQSLATLAEGAALRGADLGAEGEEVYTGGLGERPLRLTESSARAAVSSYLSSVGAYADHPGLDVSVSVDGTRVEVRLSADVDLPLTLPGAPDSAEVTGTGSAVADPE